MAPQISLPSVGSRLIPGNTPKYIPLGDEYVMATHDKGAIAPTTEAFVVCVDQSTNMYVAAFKDVNGEYEQVEFYPVRKLTGQFDNWPRIRRVVIEYPKEFEGISRMPQVTAVQIWNGDQQKYVTCTEFLF